MSEPVAALPVLVPRPSHDLDRLKRLLLAGIAAPNSRRAYARALTDFVEWYVREPRGPFSKLVVEEYRTHLSTLQLAPSTINVRLSAIRKLASQAAEAGLLSAELASGIQRLKGARKLGVRAGNWLTKEQASQLIHSPDTKTLKGKRDRALLTLLIGCGLRRSELAGLSFDHIQQREGRWVLPDPVGKGGRLRTVPLPAWVKCAIDEWAAVAGLSEDRCFGRLTRVARCGSRALRPRSSGGSCFAMPSKSGFRSWRPMTSDVPARSYAALPAAISSKSNCCSVMPPFRPPSNTSARGRIWSKP